MRFKIIDRKKMKHPSEIKLFIVFFIAYYKCSQILSQLGQDSGDLWAFLIFVIFVGATRRLCHNLAGNTGGFST